MKLPWLRYFGTLVCLAASSAFAADATAPSFATAKPIWPKGREAERNLSVGFRASFQAPAKGRVWLRATGSTLYRVWLNGEFLAHGPARAAHGFYRVDELDLTSRLKPGANFVAFEVAGYNVNSFYLLDQPSFLQAEVVADGKVLASTGGAGRVFEATVLRERVQKVQRYSFQRPFTEVYRLAPDDDAWRRCPVVSMKTVKCAVQPKKALLPRRIAQPDYTLRQPSWRVSGGELRTGVAIAKPWKDRSLTGIGPKLGGYLEKELETIPSLELQTVANAGSTPINQPYAPGQPLSLHANGYEIADFGCNLTGFIGARVTCRSKTRLVLAFDEILTNGDVDFKRLSCVNAVVWELEPGSYELESFEPYTLRYLKLMSLGGDCAVERLWLREFVSAGVGQAQFAASDERFNRLFAAGRETFRQNALDIFMDCPSRERAGWLCDSFFTARVALDLCGDTRIERCFLENFQLPPKFAHLPDGMLPMCYPADHYNGQFIPNWALWFVVELDEYLARSGDRALVDALRGRVLKLFEFFKQYRNEDGLLEKLPSWVFVEWSKANSFVQDVNYPSNMLYAAAMAAAARMYGVEEMAREATRIRETVRKQSFDGEFFMDNAVRKDGKLNVTRNRTEVCQYFAFFFNVATPQSHAKLWRTLVSDFGPQRKQTKAHAEVHPANAFIGNVLRLELLSRNGLCQQLLDESLAYHLYMADRTGTLWEHDGTQASCNHGFASHCGVHVLYRDVLGLRDVDSVKKTVALRFSDLKLDWCEGVRPTPDGLVTLRWRKDSGKLLYQVTTPTGYAVTIENRSALELVRQP
jgi:alpha-L-rhamnosidase